MKTKKVKKTPGPTYKYEGSRTISRDGIPIASITGVSTNGEVGATPYAIGMPADLDDFAREIVAALNSRRGG